MAKIWGTLLDFSLDPLSPYSPRLYLVPSEASTAGTLLLSSRPFPVGVADDGSFSVDVKPTDDIMPPAWYTVRVEWMDASGGFIGVDQWDYKINVPAEGGAIGDLMETPANPSRTWVGVDPPPNVAPGTWWLQVNPDDPDDPRATGVLVEWV